MVIKQKFITRQDLKDNRDRTYLFGDNLMEVGMGGQAAEMRYELNAIGIPTKKFPSTYKNAYFSDNDFEQLKPILDKIFDKIKQHNIIVIPEDGIGTGLAKLDKKAPKIFEYINQFLNSLE